MPRPGRAYTSEYGIDILLCFYFFVIVFVYREVTSRRRANGIDWSVVRSRNKPTTNSPSKSRTKHEKCHKFCDIIRKCHYFCDNVRISVTMSQFLWQCLIFLRICHKFCDNVIIFSNMSHIMWHFDCNTRISRILTSSKCFFSYYLHHIKI